MFVTVRIWDESSPGKGREIKGKRSKDLRLKEVGGYMTKPFFYAMMIPIN